MYVYYIHVHDMNVYTDNVCTMCTHMNVMYIHDIDIHTCVHSYIIHEGQDEVVAVLRIRLDQ